MLFRRIMLATLLPISFTLASCGVADRESESVKTRENIMKDWKDATEIMQKMVEDPASFNAQVFQEQAQFLAESANSPWSHFDDVNQKHHAAEAVWNDAEGFKAASDNFEQATAELNAVAKTATSVEEVIPAFKKVGASCGSCHKVYKAD